MQDKKNHRFYAACPWGLEAVLEEELAACGAKRSRKTPSGVMFEGMIETAYLACLRSRIASRVMMEVSFPPHALGALFHAGSDVPHFDFRSPRSAEVS